MPGALTGAILVFGQFESIGARSAHGTVGRVRVTQHRYAVEGWGVGELIVSGGLVLTHELPDAALALNGTAGGAADAGPPFERRLWGSGGPPTPWGDASPPEVTLARSGGPVCADFAPDLVGVTGTVADAGAGLAREPDPVDEADLVGRVVARVRAHLGGRMVSYDDVSLDLSWCTEFQRELTHALRAVPWGEVVSYGELAALAGRPGAARAAGRFCAQNRFALMVPCHRVVSSDGIGGYGASGVKLKRRLLRLEGIEL